MLLRSYFNAPLRLIFLYFFLLSAFCLPRTLDSLISWHFDALHLDPFDPFEPSLHGLHFLSCFFTLALSSAFPVFSAICHIYVRARVCLRFRIEADKKCIIIQYIYKSVLFARHFPRLLIFTCFQLSPPSFPQDCGRICTRRKIHMLSTRACEKLFVSFSSLSGLFSLFPLFRPLYYNY